MYLVWVAYGTALHRPVREVASDFRDASTVTAALRRIDASGAADEFEKRVEGCLT